ncbi:nucleotidyltransferase domain-containing protein [Lederbergia wuyishanensis]|uniref:Nucleotidyltransferase n=1 Tax=Lederbergia wuyishanensis TaxID=1347903 RepID=A0ABU0D6E9_9BACI|nr:nucleotidyltransferase domain-containing protein [Lederbergia wuyishanensis]MCJ8008610.1 nucleotidyltransferase domain-containing protein [Lederbergia wuyishanensis]MDQ0343974.1 hypothetical protein [Lederbergia wuyishanensis]
MKLSKFDAINKMVGEKFPLCNVVFLAGSAARGEETATSDLDIIVMDETIDTNFRESFFLYGWKMEVFIHNKQTYLDQFNMDRDKGIPILGNMLAEGKIIRDNGTAPKIKNTAIEFIKAGPTPLSESFINASRYFIYDLLDDFLDAKSHYEAIITLNTISIQLADFILRVNGQWAGRGKGLTRALQRYDHKLSMRFFSALDCYYKEGNKKPFINFVDEIYEPLGGRFFDGFVQGKK